MVGTESDSEHQQVMTDETMMKCASVGCRDWFSRLGEVRYGVQNTHYSVSNVTEYGLQHVSRRHPTDCETEPLVRLSPSVFALSVSVTPHSSGKMEAEQGRQSHFVLRHLACNLFSRLALLTNPESVPDRCLEYPQLSSPPAPCCSGALLIPRR